MRKDGCLLCFSILTVHGNTDLHGACRRSVRSEVFESCCRRELVFCKVEVLFLCFYSKKQTGFYLNVTKKKMSKWCVSCKRCSSETQHHNPQTRKHLRFNNPAFWFPNMMTGNPARIKDNVFSELQQPQWNTSSVIHFLLCSAVSAEYAELSASVGKRPHCWGLELVAEIKQDVLLLVPWWN